MSSYRDIVNLLKYFNIDRDVTVTVQLPSKNKGKKDNTKWVLKLAIGEKKRF